MKPSQLPWKWLLSGLVAVLLIFIALIPWLIGDTSRYGDRVAERLSAWTGGKVRFTKPVEVSLFPDVSIRGPLQLSGGAHMPYLKSMTVKEAKVSLDLVDLLRGRVSIDVLRLQKPKIKLRDAAKTKAPAKSILASLLSEAPIRVLHVRNGRIELAGGPVKDFYLQLDAGEQTGAISGDGSFAYKEQTVGYTVESGSPGTAEAVPVKISITSNPVKAKISGTASVAEAFKFDGDMQAEIANVRDFLNWVGFDIPRGDSLKAATLAGPFHLGGGILAFDDGAFSLDGNKAAGVLALSAAPRPRVEGTFAFDRLVLDPYLGKPGADGTLFDGALLGYIDADLRISGGEIAAGPIYLGKGGFTITAKDGSVTSEIGELELCGGTAEGRVNLELAPPTKTLGVATDLTDIAIEPCLKSIGLAGKVTGTAALKSDLSSKGNTLAEITRNLGGSFTLDAHDGTFAVNLSKLSSAPAVALNTDGWGDGGDSAFNALKAECRLDAGHIWCQSLKVETPGESVTGSGDVDLPKRTLNWNLSVARLEGSSRGSPQVKSNPLNVSIRGPWSQPSIQRTDRSTAADSNMSAGAEGQPH